MKKIRWLFLLVFLFSISMIFVQIRDKNESQAIKNDLSKAYYRKTNSKIEAIEDDIAIEKEVITKEPIEFKDENPPILDEFDDLLEKNKNTVAWLKIENTNIDYPVVQGEDNDFYLNHDFYGKRNSQGSIFMDFRNSIDLSDKHTIIYGHHMKNRTMFNDLNFFKDPEFLKANRNFAMKSLYEEYNYEIFSSHLYENDPYIIKTRFNGDEFSSFLEKINDRADYDLNIDLGEDDKILTLITCAYDFKDARYVVHARKIK